MFDVGGSHAQALFRDLRARVIGDIVSGASRRAAAEYYGISPSVVVIWAQRFETTGSVAASQVAEALRRWKAREFLLALIAKQPDLTLDEIVAAMNKRGIPGSRSAVWRFYDRRNISFKKNFVRGGAKARDVAHARRRWMREQGMFDPARLVFIDETCTNTAMVRLRGRARVASGSLTTRRMDIGRQSPSWPAYAIAG